MRSKKDQPNAARMTIEQRLGAELSARREEAGMSKYRLCQATGVHYGYISALEEGVVNVPTLHKRNNTNLNSYELAKEVIKHLADDGKMYTAQVYERGAWYSTTSAKEASGSAGTFTRKKSPIPRANVAMS